MNRTKSSTATAPNIGVFIGVRRAPTVRHAASSALVPPAWLVGSYFWVAVLGDLHRRAGNLEIAQRHRERALASAPTEAVRDSFRRRLAASA